MKSEDLSEVRRTLWKAADELRANSTLTPADYRGPVLGLIFLAFELGWLLTYASLGQRARAWLQRPGRAVMFDRATGGIFLLAAGLLALTRRAST